VSRASILVLLVNQDALAVKLFNISSSLQVALSSEGSLDLKLLLKLSVLAEVGHTLLQSVTGSRGEKPR
jgi:hypothetical protein